MRYLFRDVAYKGKTILFIKPPDIDSDGYCITTSIAEMQGISLYIEYTEPQTIVIALLGRGIVGCSREDENRGPILQEFQREYRRLPDNYYVWKVAEIVQD